MKKSIKKIMSAFMAVSCMVSATAINTNAENSLVLPAEVENYLSENGYTAFNGESIYYGKYSPHDFYYDGQNIVGVKSECAKICFEVETTDDWSNVVAIHRLVVAVGYEDKPGFSEPEYDFVRSCHDVPVMKDGKCYDFVQMDLINDAEVDLRAFVKRLSEISEIYNFKYTNERIEVHDVYANFGEDVTDYREITENQVELMNNYINANADDFADFTVEVEEEPVVANRYRYHLVPNENVTIDEHFATAEKIQKYFGTMPYTDDLDLSMLKMATQIGRNFTIDGECSYYYDLGEVDVSNSVDGDANEDGDMNIADATAIVQAIGNPDKYKLTTQGEFNADVDGNGLTGLDAVAIQVKLTSK